MTAAFSSLLVAIALGAEPSATTKGDSPIFAETKIGTVPGIGLPFGIPPGPEDPAIARVAPEKCLLYVNWAGTAAPDPKSTSQAEQLLAEPEVQRFLAAVGKAIEGSVSGNMHKGKAPDGKDSPVSPKDVVGCLHILLTHPTAIFVADIKLPERKARLVKPKARPKFKPAVAEDSPQIEIHAGMVVSLGPQAVALRATAEKLLKQLLEQYKAKIRPKSETFEQVQIAGQSWYRSQKSANASPLLFGFKDSYFIAAVGEGTLEGILARSWANQGPAWLAAALAKAPVERRTGIVYLNLKALRESLAPVVDADDKKNFNAVIEMLGLDNAEALVSTTGLDESGYVNKLLLMLDGKPRGLLQLVSDRPLRSEDLRPIPRDATLALALRFDLRQAVEIVMAASEKMSPQARDGMKQGIEHLNRQLGIDVRGLLGSLGDTWCVYNSPHEGGFVLTGLTAVVPIHNNPMLAVGYAKILELAKKSMPAPAPAPAGEMPMFIGPNAAPQFRHFTFNGHEICYVNAMVISPAWCMTPQEIVMALNVQNVKAYLSRREHQSLATAPEVARLLQGSDGPMAIGYTDTPKLFELLYPFVSMYVPLIAAFTQPNQFDFDLASWPSAPAVSRHLRPDVTTLGRTPHGIQITCHYSFPTGGTNLPILWIATALQSISPGEFGAAGGLFRGLSDLFDSLTDDAAPPAEKKVLEKAVPPAAPTVPAPIAPGPAAPAPKIEGSPPPPLPVKPPLTTPPKPTR